MLVKYFGRQILLYPKQFFPTLGLATEVLNVDFLSSLEGETADKISLRFLQLLVVKLRLANK